MVINGVVPALYSAEKLVMSSQNSAEYMDPRESGLDVVILEMVQQALSGDMDYALSPALMRCYECIVSGDKMLCAEDVMEAMPELLNYTLKKYEGSEENMGAMRSLRSCEQGVPACAYVQKSPTSSCGSVSAELCQILNLLKVLKKRIGCVQAPVCTNSVLAILGDACQVFGPDSNISKKIAEILDTINKDDEKIFRKLNSVKSKLGHFGDSIDFVDSQTCDVVFDNVSDGLTQIYCKQLLNIECCAMTLEAVADLNFTVTQCCDDLADDIFDARTILVEQIADLKETVTGCCEDLADDIFETQSILRTKIKHLKEIVEECCHRQNHNFNSLKEQLEHQNHKFHNVNEHLDQQDKKLHDLKQLLDEVLKLIKKS